MTKIKHFAALAALGLSVSFAPMAMAEDEVAADVQEKLTAQLTGEGYEVREFEMEDGLIEVYTVKDGKTVSLFFDADLKLVKTEG